MPGALAESGAQHAENARFRFPPRSWHQIRTPPALGRGAVRELHEAIVALVESGAKVMCAECLANAIGRSAGAVVMAMLGLVGRVTSLHGVCSGCHRRAMVVERVARSVVTPSSTTASRPNAKDTPA